MQTYCWSVAIFLLLSAILHLAAPRRTDRWLSLPPLVRVIGALLVLASLPCLVWRGWYFWLLFAALSISGLWRLLFPRHSIQAQQRSYPRWVPGCLLLGGAILVWVAMP